MNAMFSPQNRPGAATKWDLDRFHFSASLHLCIFIVCLISSPAFAAGIQNSKAIPIAKVKHSGPVDFEREILPIFKNNCLACHNQTKPKGGLILETPQTILKGGDTGPAVVPKKARESLLLKVAAHEDPETIMPPPDNKVAATPLRPDELGLLQLWIEQGAKGEVRAVVPIVWQPVPPGLNTIYAVALTRDGQFAACGRANQIFVYHLPSGRLAGRLNDARLQKTSNAGAAHRDTVNSLAFSPDGELLASGGYREAKLWRRAQLSDATGRVPAGLTAIITNKQLLVLDTNGAALRTNAFPKALDELRGDSRALFQVNESERELTFAKTEIEFRKSGLKSAETNQAGRVARRNKAADTNAALAKIAQEKESALTNAFVAHREAENAVHELGPEISKLVEAFFAAERDFTNAAAQAKAADKSSAEKLAAEATAKSNALAVARAALEGLPAETKAKQKLATDKLLAGNRAIADAERELKKAEQSHRTAGHELQLAEQAVHTGDTAVTGAKSALSIAEDEMKRAEKNLEVAKQALEQSRPARALAYSPDEKALATIDDTGTAHFWSAETGAPFDPTWKANWLLERTLGTSDANSPLADRVNALRFTPDGQQLITGGGEPTRGGEIKLWRVKDGALLRDLTNIHSDSVLALEISADGKFLVSGAADRFARIVDLTTGKVLKTFEGHTHHVLGVALKRDARTLVTAGADNVAKTWDAMSGERRKNIEGFNKEVTAAAFVGVGDQAVLTAGDGQVVLVKSTGEKVRSFNGASDYVNAAAVTPDGAVIVAGGSDGVLRVWDGTSGKLLSEFRGD